MLQYYESYYQLRAQRQCLLRISASEKSKHEVFGYPPGTATQVRPPWHITSGLGMQQERVVQMLGGANQQQHQMALPAPMMPGLTPEAHCGGGAAATCVWEQKQSRTICCRCYDAGCGQLKVSDCRCHKQPHSCPFRSLATVLLEVTEGCGWCRAETRQRRE